MKDARPDTAAQGMTIYPGQEVSFSASVNDSLDKQDRQGGNSGRCPGGRDPTLGATICAKGMVTMMVSTAQHVYGFTFNTLVVKTNIDEVTVPSFRVGPIPLPKDSETRLTGSQTFTLDHYHRIGIYQQVGDVKAVVSWNLEPPAPLEVVLESDAYQNWIPEGNLKDVSQPGKSLTFKATVKKRDDPNGHTDKKARITFNLDGVSMEKGVCLNYPSAGGKADYDLKFLQDQNSALDVVGPDQAKTRNQVSEASVTISSFDYGAWGNLKVTAENDDGTIPVKFQGKEDPVITVPRNDTGQHVATAWLSQFDMEGTPDSADQATAPGQGTVGDGLTLYEKYRGVAVLAGGDVVFKRLDPTKKVHFLIDDKDLVDRGRWEGTTGTLVYKLNNDLVKDRQVDFNGGYTGFGHKYAVHLELISGLADPDTDEGTIRLTRLGATLGASPKRNQLCRVYPDRIRAKIARIAKAIQQGIDDPKSEEADFMRKIGISNAEASRQLATLPARLEQLVQNLVALVAIHESTHACGVSGHGSIAIGKEEWTEDDDQGNLFCPMLNMSRAAWRRFVLYGELGGGGTLCQLCAKVFNVKD